MLTALVAASAMSSTSLADTDEWKDYVKALGKHKEWSVIVSAVGERAKENRETDYNGFAYGQAEDGYRFIFLEDKLIKWDGKKGIFLNYREKTWKTLDAYVELDGFNIARMMLPLGDNPPKGSLSYLTKSKSGSREIKEAGWEVLSVGMHYQIRYRYYFDKKTKMLSEFSVDAQGSGPGSVFLTYGITWVLSPARKEGDRDFTPPSHFRRID